MQLVCTILFVSCFLHYFRIVKKTFFCWLKQLMKYHKRLLALILELYIVKMSHWYQVNPKVFLYKTALSAQICYIARSLPLKKKY